MATTDVTECRHGTWTIRAYESASCLACRAEKAEARVAELEERESHWRKAVSETETLEARIAELEAAMCCALGHLHSEEDYDAVAALVRALPSVSNEHPFYGPERILNVVNDQGEKIGETYDCGVEGCCRPWEEDDDG